MSFLKYNHGAAPSTPASGKSETYVDTADRRVKQLDDLGVTSVLSRREPKENHLINGGFDFAQRQVATTLTPYSNTSGRALSADRWGITNENASVQFQQVDSSGAPETALVARNYGKFKKITSGGKMVISQVAEGNVALDLRGKTVRFTAKMKYSVAAAMSVRLGLLYLTSAGTIDTMPATFVSAFGAVGTDPTWGTNLTALAPLQVDGGAINGLGMDCVLTNAWVRYSATFTIPASCKNVIAVIWTNGQPAVNDELNIAEVGLYEGAEIVDWSSRPAATELLLCQRYYCKTFPVLTAPAQSAGVSGALRGAVAVAGAVTTSSVMQWRFPVEMLKAPTLTFYNPSAANAFMRDVPAATDATATAAASTTADCTDINATGLAGWTVGQELKVHAQADAEI